MLHILLRLLLLLLSFIPRTISSVAVIQTCTESHIWLESLSEENVVVAPLERNFSKGISIYKNKTVLDRRCSQLPSTFEVSYKNLISLVGLIRPSCSSSSSSSPSSKESDEVFFPISANMIISKDGELEIEMRQENPIVVASSLFPVDCIILSQNSQKILKLSDEKGCAIDSFMDPFEEEFDGKRRIFRSKVSFEKIPSSSGFHIQCSLTSCGDQCLTPCSSRQFPQSATGILVSAFLPPSFEKSENGDCSWWKYRLFALFSVLILFFTSFLSFYIAYKNFLWKEKELWPIWKKKSSRRLHIIHPIDYFHSPPIITTGKENQIPFSENSSNSTEYSFSSSSTEEKDFQSHLVCSEVMENLPEPPSIAVAHLRTIAVVGPTAKTRQKTTTTKEKTTTKEELPQCPPRPLQRNLIPKI